jgi:hypothetical protein
MKTLVLELGRNDGCTVNHPVNVLKDAKVFTSNGSFYAMRISILFFKRLKTHKNMQCVVLGSIQYAGGICRRWGVRKCPLERSHCWARQGTYEIGKGCYFLFGLGDDYYFLDD